MQITMSPQDYATAFRLLSGTSRHHIIIAEIVAERIVPHLPERPSLRDVGTGPGTVAERLAPYFGSITLIEPNQQQLGSFALEGAEIFHDVFENFETPRQYDLVLCSHVMYHVPLAEWGDFVDRLLAFVRPAGYCMIVLGAARGQNYELHRDFTSSVIDSSLLIETLKAKQIPFEVVGGTNSFTAESSEDMYTLCRFFVLEDCYSTEQIAALTEAEANELDRKIRMHAGRCRTADGRYRLEQDDDAIIIRKQ
jgi:SAM-dependent methyltransferase